MVSQMPVICAVKKVNVPYCHHLAGGDPVYFGPGGGTVSTIRLSCRARLWSSPCRAKTRRAALSNHVARRPVFPLFRGHISRHAQWLELTDDLRTRLAVADAQGLQMVLTVTPDLRSLQPCA